MQLKPPNMLRHSWSRIFPTPRLNSERRKRKKPLGKCTYGSTPLFVLMVVAILSVLPRSSSMSLAKGALPDGDPAPGRSPGPPVNGTDLQFEINITASQDFNAERAENQSAEVTTSVVEVASASGNVANSGNVVSGGISEDLCVCREEDVITINAEDSDINLTFSHSVFDTEVELVRGVTYEVADQEVEDDEDDISGHDDYESDIDSEEILGI